MPSNIHPSALISDQATIADNVEIGPFTIVHDHVHIGEGSVIGSYCELGVKSPLAERQDLFIGDRSLIRSHCVFYAGSSFGPNLVTGHRVTVRENTKTGCNFQIGTLGDIQGHCVVGNHVKCHSNVHIGQLSRIGDYVWMFPYVVLTNDPHPPSESLVGCLIEDFAVISTMSVVLPGVCIGRGALIGAMCLVRQDVPPDTICVGVPGRNVGQTDKIRNRMTGEPAYPWRRHFHRGYPADIVEEWVKEFEQKTT
jgi:acyl-[acyl carrier protein]--UDP-N-acetylglucosamine O-acyltransferase